VISDIYQVFNHPVSLRWTALTPKDTTYEGFFKLNYAADWPSFKSALSHQVAPGMNMLYADRQGNIGYLGAGKIPIRQQGRGDLPVPGWREDYRWTGFVPPAQWPQSFNPEQGYIVNANNKAVADDYPYFVSQDWAPPARAARISQLLTEKMAQPGYLLTTDDMADIQADTVSLAARQLLPQLVTLAPNTAQQEQAIELLSQWDGDMHRDSQAASLYLVWSRFLRRALFADELTGQWGEQQKSGFLRSVSAAVTERKMVEVLQSVDGRWCDNINTDGVENCAMVLSSSLDNALEQLGKINGNDIDDWQWGAVNSTAYEHQPFSNIKVLDTLFERKFSNGGAANTVNVSGSGYSPSEGYLQVFGAGFRQIIGLSEQHTRHLLMNSTGQSGNVLSDNYDDMIVPFRDVEFISMDELSLSLSDKRQTLLPFEATLQELK
jgi:penicillin amidase